MGGGTTEAAADGEEALQGITAFRPSIIIGDLVMPRMGGLDLLRSLKDEGGERFSAQAAEALEEPNLLFVATLAEKTATLAAELLGR